MCSCVHVHVYIKCATASASDLRESFTVTIKNSMTWAKNIVNKTYNSQPIKHSIYSCWIYCITPKIHIQVDLPSSLVRMWFSFEDESTFSLVKTSCLCFFSYFSSYSLILLLQISSKSTCVGEKHFDYNTQSVLSLLNYCMYNTQT